MKKVLSLVLVFVMALSGVSFAADWPTGTVNVVLPYGTGGDTDTYCRQLFQRVSKITGQTFVVINQQG
ncbi:MAG: tripartite tricarboxylate transporter substrate binding protein, partial [Synergistaceae bacterium]|nr:tripartite tricarboxylate transporter substrate binding protein [Synergistaceae bacterium]